MVTDANSDGTGAQTSGNVTATVNVTALNDRPVATAGGTLQYTENGVAAVIDASIGLSDADDTHLGRRKKAAGWQCAYAATESSKKIVQ